MIDLEFESFEVWENFWCFKPKRKIDLTILETLNFSSTSTVKNNFEFWIDKNEDQKSPSKFQILKPQNTLTS